MGLGVHGVSAVGTSTRGEGDMWDSSEEPPGSHMCIAPGPSGAAREVAAAAAVGMADTSAWLKFALVGMGNVIVTRRSPCGGGGEHSRSVPGLAGRRAVLFAQR